ncbi:trio [Drosophila busckii]|uniref:Trio n=1 Tax=Drosophila busckii TaxID=30019 RepID=A0A0M4EMG1_DROBS|nr:trio [Drosophila busckii]
MKSVKKFLNERINSVDAADVGGVKKTPLERLKCSNSAGEQTGSLDSANFEATLTPLAPLSAPIAIGDPSPSPSLAESAQNTPLCTLEEDSSTSPKESSNGEAATAPLEHSPFTFPTVTAAASASQPRKSRRKISLPWFRQSSVSSHGVLSRQHTIDTPSSFRFFRQPSSSGFKLGNQEATWVVADYIASSGSNELSVSKGQQVEIIEPPTASEPDFCLVRLNPQHDDAAVQEGLVPVSVLKPPPGAHKQGSSTANTAAATAASQKSSDNMQDAGNRSKADALSSSTKRRGFSGTGKIEGNPLSEIEQIVRMSREQHESNSRGDGIAVGEEALDASASTNGRAHGAADLGFEQDNNDKNKSEGSDISAALHKRQQSLNELVATEETYVQELQKIVHGYMKEINCSDIPRPADLQGGKMDLVFNNIKDIYEWHRDKFLRGLRHCQKSPADLGPLIEKSRNKFIMYYHFCSNKPLSDFIVTANSQYFDQIRDKLGHRLDLSSLLIMPVQRIPRYEMMIDNILKHTTRACLKAEMESLTAARDQIKIVAKTVNDMMEVLRSLQDFDGEITAQGNLLLQGNLNCVIDAGQKQRELKVFLFQQIIIFADIQKAKTQYSNPVYKYRTHIQLNHIHLQTLRENEYSFRIKSTDPNKPPVTIDCQAASQESYEEWQGMLNKILDEQNVLILKLVDPLNNKKN